MDFFLSRLNMNFYNHVIKQFKIQPVVWGSKTNNTWIFLLLLFLC